jgi:hypothetical protein
MAQSIEVTGKRYDLGLVKFSTEPGAADNFAREISQEWSYEDDVYVVLGTRWAAAMEDESTVIAAVRTDEGELDAWVDVMKEKYAHYGLNPNGHAVARYFKDGRSAAAGHDGMP